MMLLIRMNRPPVMKLNENTKVIGNKVVLVPYKKIHVNRYHSWMQNEELLEKTASEPLTIDEEYEMQRKWWMDEDKCTFIVLCKKSYLSCTDPENAHITAMVGDVNLFLNNLDDRSEAELEVMIAEPNVRRNGYGKESVVLMLYYGFKFLSIQKYIVKIGTDNHGSIKMFLNLGFQMQSFSEVFQETTYYLLCDSEYFQKSVLDEIGSCIQIQDFS